MKGLSLALLELREGLSPRRNRHLAFTDVCVCVCGVLISEWLPAEPSMGSSRSGRLSHTRLGGNPRLWLRDRQYIDKTSGAPVTDWSRARIDIYRYIFDSSDSQDAQGTHRRLSSLSFNV